MWDSESERIGKQKCTPMGSVLHGIGELIGFLGLLALLAFAIWLGWSWMRGSFRAALWWWVALPLGMGILSEVVVQYSWWLAFKKGFRYDGDKRESSWMDGGERQTYRWTPPADPK